MSRASASTRPRDRDGGRRGAGGVGPGRPHGPHPDAHGGLELAAHAVGHVEGGGRLDRELVGHALEESGVRFGEAALVRERHHVEEVPHPGRLQGGAHARGAVAQQAQPDTAGAQRAEELGHPGHRLRLRAQEGVLRGGELGGIRVGDAGARHHLPEPVLGRADPPQIARQAGRTPVRQERRRRQAQTPGERLLVPLAPDGVDDDHRVVQVEDHGHRAPRRNPVLRPAHSPDYRPNPSRPQALRGLTACTEGCVDPGPANRAYIAGQARWKPCRRGTESRKEANHGHGCGTGEPGGGRLGGARREAQRCHAGSSASWGRGWSREPRTTTRRASPPTHRRVRPTRTRCCGPFR